MMGLEIYQWKSLASIYGRQNVAQAVFSECPFIDCKHVEGQQLNRLVITSTRYREDHMIVCVNIPFISICFALCKRPKMITWACHHMVRFLMHLIRNMQILLYFTVREGSILILHYQKFFHWTFCYKWQRWEKVGVGALPSPFILHACLSRPWGTLY